MKSTTEAVLRKKNRTPPTRVAMLAGRVDFPTLLFRRGLNISDIAAASGVSRQTLHVWLRGAAVRFRPDKVLPVARAMGVEVDELLAVLHETRRRAEAADA